MSIHITETFSALSRATRNLWRHIATAEWVGDTGLPIVVTLAGFVLALCIFGRQLRSDRAHLTETLMADQSAREAERFRGLAERLAAGLADSVAWTKDEELAASNRVVFDSNQAGRRALLYATVWLKGVAGSTELLNDLEQVYQAGANILEICRDQEALLHDGGDVQEAAHARALLYVLRPCTSLLSHLIVKLQSWDGHKDLPSVGLAEDHDDLVEIASLEPTGRELVRTRYAHALEHGC